MPRSTTKIIKLKAIEKKGDTLIIEHVVLMKILRGKHQGTIVEIGEDPVIAGRSEETDLAIDDPSASRQHFEVITRFGTHILRDLHSTNGTLVNGVKVAECRLSNGDIVKVGTTEIGFFEQKKVRARRKGDSEPPGPPPLRSID